MNWCQWINVLLQQGNKFALNKDMLTVPSCRRGMNGGRKFGHHHRLAKEISGGRGLCWASESHLVPGCLQLPLSGNNLSPGCQGKAICMPRNEMALPIVCVSCKLRGSHLYLVGILGQRGREKMGSPQGACTSDRTSPQAEIRIQKGEVLSTPSGPWALQCGFQVGKRVPPALWQQARAKQGGMGQ